MHWIIALQEEPDDRALRLRFDAWRTASEGHARAWAEAQHVWNVLGVVAPAARPDPEPVATAIASDMARLRPAASRRFRHPVLVGLACAAIAACLTLFVAPSLSIWLFADYSTGTAELRDIRLDDGSVVHLGADSAIDVSFETGRRKVSLLSGEAFFDVAPNPQRPFIVDAGEVETTVLGTGFDVQRASDGVTIAVEHGRVAVDCSCLQGNREAPLEAGDWARISSAGGVARGKSPPELIAAWRQGTLAVNDTSVGDVIDTLRRYFPGSIVMADPYLATRRVTGLYRLDDPVAALAAVAEAHGARVRRVSPWIAVVSTF